MIQFHKILDGPWDDVRGYLREDLDHLESAFNALARAGTGGGGTWGSITGTLASQTDLAAALAAATTGPAGATGATGAAGAAGATGPAGPGIKVYEQPDEPGAAIAGDIWIDSDVPLAATVAVWGGITGTLSTQTDLQNALNLKAPLASPALTGVPTAPTAAPGTNTTQIATTAYTRSEIAALVASSPATLDTLNELALALGSDPNFATTTATALAGKSGATATSTITTTGTQTALAIPTGTGDLIIRANNATLLDVQGIAAGIDGQRLIIESVGGGQVDFSHQHASATAANRLINTATIGVTSLSAGSGTVTFVYDGTTARWRLVTHEQGAAIAVPYNSADYTALAGTWTVDAGDIFAFKYHLRGNRLTVDFFFYPTSVSAVTSILYLKIPGGYSPNVSFGYSLLMYGQPAWISGGTITVSVADTRIAFYQKDYGGTNWQISTNATALSGSITFEVS